MTGELGLCYCASSREATGSLCRLRVIEVFSVVPLFDIGNIQALAVYNLVFTVPYLRALAGGARRSNYTKWQTKVAPKQFGAKQSKVAPEAPNKEKMETVAPVAPN